MVRWRKALDRLEGAYSEQTLKGYASDFAEFEKWCAKEGLSALPAEPATLVRHIDEAALRLKPSSITRRLCGIRKIYRVLHLTDPTVDEDVVLAMRRARRKKPGRPDQALGLTADLRDRLVAECSDDLIGLRDEIMVRVGFDSLCRRAELVALRVEDLTINNRGNLSILVRRAKTDQEGSGRTVHLSRVTSERVRVWLEASDIDTGPLLRPIYQGKTVSRFLSPMTVARVLKKLAARAAVGIDTVPRVSGHSLRVGAAQQLTIDGYGILPIMRAGGWRSMNTVARYIENVDMDVWEERVDEGRRQ